jgi:hypothetical protein
MNNSFAVAQHIINDIQSGALKCDDSNREGINPANYHHIVTWSQWQKIDQREIENGKKRNKPREKFLNVDEMLKIVYP